MIDFVNFFICSNQMFFKVFENYILIILLTLTFKHTFMHGNDVNKTLANNDENRFSK